MQKHKVWHKLEKETYIVLDIFFTKDGKAMAFEGHRINSSTIKLLPLNESIILLHSTGFSDRNGNAIFEGDIARADFGKVTIQFAKVRSEYVSGFFVTHKNIKTFHELTNKNSKQLEVVLSVFQ